MWWSRYWAYSDQELDELVRGFHENDTPLDVLVIDMDWHMSQEQLKAMGEKDQSGYGLGWSGYTWNKTLFPDPDAFLKKIHEEGLKTTMNLHPASGIQPWEQAYPAMARAMGIDPATKKYIPFDIADKKLATNYMNLVLHPLEKQGIDFWWLDWQQQPMMTKLPGLANTLVAELRALYRSAARGQAAAAVSSLGRAGQPSLPDWIFGRHGFGVGFAGVSAVVYGDGGQRGLRLLEPRHWRTHARRGRSGAVHAVGAVRRVLADIAHAHDEESRCGAADLGLSRAVFVGAADGVPIARGDGAVSLHRGAAHLRHGRGVFAAALLRLAGGWMPPTTARTNTCLAIR